jgi:peptidoglycan hydrolase-like protein with peptidoglycan-binding domain
MTVSALAPPIAPRPEIKPAEPVMANALVEAASRVAAADLAPVVSRAVALSASRKIADLASPIEISEVQRLLARLDFRPGLPDGMIGRRTVTAIRLYQKFGGLDVTGRATLELLEDLRAVAARVPEPAR